MTDSESIRLPDGRITTRHRAINRGWLDKDGNLTALAPRPRREQVAVEKANRERQWRRSQGLPEPVEAEAVLAGKKPKRVEPLKPKNVTKTGEVITDSKLLDEIAAKTAAIEAAKAAQDA